MCVLAPSAGSCSRSSLLKRNGLCTAVAPLPRTACHLQSRSVVISALSRGFLPGSGRLRKGAMLPSGHEAEAQRCSCSHRASRARLSSNQSNVNQTIYDQKGSSQRVMRAVNGSETDFTIHIRDVRLEDAGTYYCVKFRRNTSGDEVFKSGGGTKVLVHGEWIPSLSWWALLWGWDGGFFPRDIQVQWLKNSVPVQAELPRITSEPSNSSYNMSSTVQVTLHKNDVRSELTCQVQHSTLSVRALRLPGECTSLCFASDLPPIYSIT
uniref:Immunoglobulin C1-set domain-containing protein n=1 Tax=Phasianus colchicus TaxID=9054 RepID=A0A669NZM2_PHACC